MRCCAMGGRGWSYWDDDDDEHRRSSYYTHIEDWSGREVAFLRAKRI
jgi:hypothetical protein